MFKKLLRFLVFVVVAVLAVGYVSLNVAAGIIIVRDQNPDGVTVLTDEDEIYQIEVDENTGIGYVICVADNERLTLGTVEVTIIDGDKEPELLCSSGQNSMGTLVITIDDDSVVTTSVGTISTIFGVGCVVNILTN